MESENENTASFAHSSNPQSPAAGPIVDVWAHNFRAEIARVSSIIQQYPVVSFVSDCYLTRSRTQSSRASLTRMASPPLKEQ